MMSFTNIKTRSFVYSSCFFIFLMQHRVSSANDFRLNLSPTIPNSGPGTACQSSNSRRFQTVENVASLNQQQVSEKLHYRVTFLRFGESEQERKMVEPFRCINPLQLAENFLTLHPDTNNEPNTVYFIPPLNATLVKEKSNMMVVYPFIGAKEYENGSSTVLKTGSGKLILQRICEWNDPSKVDVTILSTENNFPINNKTFMESLKRELEKEYHLILSVEKCSSEPDVETTKKSSHGNGGGGTHAGRWIYVSFIFILKFTTYFM